MGINSTLALAERHGLPLAPYPTLTGSEPCRESGTDPEDWFSNHSGAAVRACRRCPLQVKCLAYALDHPFETSHGIWAATTPERREFLRDTYYTTDTATDPE